MAGVGLAGAQGGMARTREGKVSFTRTDVRFGEWLPMDRTRWQQHITERRGTPPPLDDHRFRTWMTGRPIFVSSASITELTPARDAVRAFIHRWGGEPVMWEEITPRDQRAHHAYLDGVDRSDLLVLLLGTRYGVSDHSGYSPTHQERNWAAARGIPRLLFERAGMAASERDGKLNDWVRSLYNEVSGSTYSDPQELVLKLEKQLREIAGAQEMPWVKLGPLVVPGTVERRGSHGRVTYEVCTALRDAGARRAVAELMHGRHHLAADRLTWALRACRSGA